MAIITYLLWIIPSLPHNTTHHKILLDTLLASWRLALEDQKSWQKCAKGRESKSITDRVLPLENSRPCWFGRNHTYSTREDSKNLIHIPYPNGTERKVLSPLQTQRAAQSSPCERCQDMHQCGPSVTAALSEASKEAEETQHTISKSWMRTGERINPFLTPTAPRAALTWGCSLYNHTGEKDPTVSGCPRVWSSGLSCFTSAQPAQRRLGFSSPALGLVHHICPVLCKTSRSFCSDTDIFQPPIITFILLCTPSRIARPFWEGKINK